MNALKIWIENAWWSWGNCIHFRFDKYEDNIDYRAFFEEICFDPRKLKGVISYRVKQLVTRFWNPLEGEIIA